MANQGAFGRPILATGRQTILWCGWVAFGLLIIAALSFSKGLVSSLQSSAEGYWFINYNNGFIRCELLGQIFSFFQNQADPNKVASTALYVHLVACTLLLFALWIWLRVVLDREIEARSMIWQN